MYAYYYQQPPLVNPYSAINQGFFPETSHPNKSFQQNNPRQQSPFPPVDPSGFHQSALQFQKLMQQASLLINRIVNSQRFAYQLMDGAQKSNQRRVEQLIKSTGITIKYIVRFTPTALQIELDNSKEGMNCCQMLVGLRW